MMEQLIRMRPRVLRTRRPMRADERWSDAEPGPDEECPPPKASFKDKLVYCVLVFLKVALWIGIALALSRLHMGAPCFVVALLMWIYAEPLKTLFSRAKAKMCPFSRARDIEGAGEA